MIKKYHVLALLLFHSVVWCMDHENAPVPSNLYKQALVHAASQHLRKETVPLVPKIAPKKEEIAIDIKEEANKSPKLICRFSAAVAPDFALLQPQRCCIYSTDRSLCVKIVSTGVAITLTISFVMTMIALKLLPR